jgi:glyoxylase-like metal-dependent hydrolase (beta-lactamase superfamily II)
MAIPPWPRCAKLATGAPAMQTPRDSGPLQGGRRMDRLWEVHALKYCEVTTRRRRENFLFDDDHDALEPIDFYVWLLRSQGRSILVDTGFDAAEAARRDRPIQRDPTEALDAVGAPAETIDTVIVSHLHFDHAGGLDRYPNATFHLQAAEMAYATGPCMCHGALKMPFTVDHVVEMVRHVYSGRVVFHDGDGEIAPGVTVHRMSGHSKGLQAVRVKTRMGWMCLASDA